MYLHLSKCAGYYFAYYELIGLHLFCKTWKFDFMFTNGSNHYDNIRLNGLIFIFLRDGEDFEND